MDQVKGAFQTWVDFPQPKKIKILKGITFGCFALFLLFVVIYGFGGTGKKSVTIPNVVVFMEAMPYNLQALQYLSKRRDVFVSMIVLTVNSWNTNMNAAYGNIMPFLALLEKEGYSNKIPVYYGNNVALTDLNKGTQSRTYSQYINDTSRTLANQMFDASTDLHKVEVGTVTMTFFEDALKTYLQSDKATFLVMGPCTDAAWFLQQHEDLRKKVNTIFVAGGAFNSGGNMRIWYSANTVAEINFFMDPEAADYIVGGAHGREVVVFPLDVTYTWNETSYNSIVTSELSRSDRSTITSALIVAEGLDGYYKRVGASNKRVSASVMAATYLADVYAQNGAEAAVINTAVRSGGSMTISGQSYRAPSGDYKATVILKMNEATFFDHLVRVASLGY